MSVSELKRMYAELTLENVSIRDLLSKKTSHSTPHSKLSRLDKISRPRSDGPTARARPARVPTPENYSMIPGTKHAARLWPIQTSRSVRRRDFHMLLVASTAGSALVGCGEGPPVINNAQASENSSSNQNQANPQAGSSGSDAAAASATSAAAPSSSATLYPRTQAESDAGITPANYAFPQGDVRRYGGLPGAAAAVNDLAIAAAAAVGGCVYFCAGNWQYSQSPWFKTSNVRVYGDGMGITILRPIGWIDGLRFADQNYPSASTILHDLTVHDLTIEGADQTTDGGNDTNGNGINFNSCDYITCRSVEVRNIAYQNIVSTYWNVSGETQKSVKILDCVSVNCRSTQIAIGLEGSWQSAVLTGNTIVNCSGDGIRLDYFDGSGTDNGFCVVTGNLLQGAIGGTARGIIAGDNVYNANITANEIRGFDISIRVGVIKASGYDHLISSNKCIDWTTAGIVVDPMFGADSSETLVIGNHIKSSVASASSYGLIVARGTTVAANTIRSGTVGIGCIGSDIELLANSIRGPVTAIDCSEADGVQIAMNVTDGRVLLNTDTIASVLNGEGPQLAAAPTISLPPAGDVFVVNGSAQIQALDSANSSGRTVTLVFADRSSIIGGPALRLSGPFNAAQNATLVLACAGGTWYEVSRSQNS